MFLVIIDGFSSNSQRFQTSSAVEFPQIEPTVFVHFCKTASLHPLPPDNRAAGIRRLRRLRRSTSKPCTLDSRPAARSTGVVRVFSWSKSLLFDRMVPVIVPNSPAAVKPSLSNAPARRENPRFYGRLVLYLLCVFCYNRVVIMALYTHLCPERRTGP